MSDTATVPTDEQLKQYASQLPDLYKDILAAFQYLDPSRDRGEGLYEEQLQNFLWNEAARTRIAGAGLARGVATVWDEFGARSWVTTTAQPETTAQRYRFTQAVNDYNGDAFTAAIDHLIAQEFLKPRTADATGRLVPTEVGERLIEIIAGKAPPAKKVPELPKPTWR